ncbi:MAG: D-alanine--D-alanine ligase [Clostridia bacterium]|nr:D-alanine--D-alanine ligase [Clostridia bacterium]
MLNVGVFFGGRAAEHDVSIITGTQMIENADKSKYNLFPVYISREGKWYTGEALKDAKFFLHPDLSQKGIDEVIFSPATGNRSLFKKTMFGMKSVCDLDVAVLAMHGLHGEDGTLQGIFEMADLPYTSCGVTGSSSCMDKIVTKLALIGLGIPCVDYVYYDRNETHNDRSRVIGEVEEKLGYPVIVKPANLGSSIGIKKAHEREELKDALDLAENYDRRILIEHAIDRLREINCAVLGAGSDAVTGTLEEPLAKGEILDFAAKYLPEKGQSKGMKSLDRKLPAELDEDKEKKIREYALRAFKGLDMKGVVRIDFMIDEDKDEVYLNEVNTIPGSLAFYLFEKEGIPYRDLIDRLIDIALRSMEEKKKSSYAFDSSILQKVDMTSLKTGVK